MTALKLRSTLGFLSRGMKTMTSLSLRCPDCMFVRRRGRLFVYCKKHPRHKQRQGASKGLHSARPSAPEEWLGLEAMGEEHGIAAPHKLGLAALGMRSGAEAGAIGAWAVEGGAVQVQAEVKQQVSALIRGGWAGIFNRS
jgi:ribosomal protein L36